MTLARLRIRTFLFLIVVCVTVCAVNASAQIGGGSIRGIVSDPSGAVIPNAVVTAKNVANGTVTARKTTGSGLYNLSPLEVGQYTFSVVAPGFGTHTQDKIQVDGLAVVSINVTMTPGINEVIDVTTPALNASNGTVGDTVNSQDYQLLPLVMNSAPRNPVAFVNLANGVDSSRGYNGGAVNYHNETYLEGVVATGINQQGAANNTSLGAIIEAVDESEVQTIGISAKYQGQGFNNFTMRSGTNQFHGTAFEFFRNTALDTWNYLSKSVINPATGKATKPVEKQNEYGFVIGGPIMKEKIFFFAAFEKMAYRSLPNPSYFTLPTLAMRNGDFSAYAASTGYHIFDQASTTCINSGASCRRNQFPGDIIPASRISAISQAAQKFLPTNLANANYSNNYLGSIGTGYNYFKASGKLDYQVTKAHRLSMLYLVGQRANSTGSLDGGNVLPLPYAATTNTTLYNPSGIIGDTWVISPTMVNSIKYSYFRGETIQADPTLTSQYALSTLGFTNAPPGWGAGSFIKTNFGGNFGETSWDGSGTTLNTNRPQNLVTNTYGLTDDFQWTRGRHNVSVGVQMEWYQYNSALPATGTGVSFSFDTSTSAMFTGQDAAGASTAVYGKSTVTTTSGNAYAGYLQGATTSAYVADQRNLGVLGGRFKAVSPYAQDDWKITKDLSLNLGVRWDVYGTYHEVQDRMSFFNPDLPNPIAHGAKGVIEYNGYKNQYYCQCRTRIQQYLKNVEPRFGFAYQMAPDTVLRGSYGISATHANGTGGRGGAREGTNQIGLGASQTYGQTLGYESPYNWSNPLFTPAAPTFDNTYGVGNTTTPGFTGTPATVFYDEPYLGGRSPYYQNFSFGIQHAVTSKTTVSVDYSGSLGHFIFNGNGHGIYSNQIQPQYLVLGSLLTSPANATNLAAANVLLAQNGMQPITLPYTNFSPTANIGQALRPFAQYGISNNFQSDGNSAYNAFEFSLKQRAYHGLSLTINYTYSRLEDNIATRPSTYLHSNAWNVDNGPQSLHVYGSWVTPHYGSNRLLHAATGGWIVSGIYSYNSGNPLVFTTSCSGVFGFFGACRPTLNPNFTGSVRTSVPYGSKTFKQAAFVPSLSTSPNAPFLTSTTAFGNAPYANAYGVTGPSTKNLDASIRRTFGPIERMRFTIGADMFNVTNHVEATGIGVGITNTAFGTASKQSNASRDVQLNAKIEF